MKKLPLILITILCSISAFGQSLYRPAFRSGSILMGINGSVDFAEVNNEENYYGSIKGHTLSPRIGIFILPGVVLGMDADFSSLQYEQNNYSRINLQKKENTYGPFLRIHSKDGFFVHAAYSLGKANDTYDDGYVTNDYEVRIKKLKIGLGYCFLITRSFAVEPGVMFQHYKRRSTDADYSYNDFHKNGIVLSVGLSFFLSRKSNSR